MAPRPVTLITGASSGIGTELARVFAAHGHELVLVARNEEQLKALATELAESAAVQPHVIAIDLARLDGAARVSRELAARGLEPAYVVNNAGFGLVGEAAELDRTEQVEMVDLNVRSLTDLSLRWVESLRRHKGGILNVASLAAFMPGPGMAVYYASKAFVLSFSEALHQELAPQGVRVTVLCPGPVPTGFQERAGLKAGQIFGPLVVPADKVAQAGFRGLMAGKRVVLPGFGNRLVSLLPRLLPRGVLLRAVGARQQRRRNAAEPAWPKRG
ncbi:MAG: uncharacterized protein QOD74_513 [Variibacter sp.]|jgi:short-subunit dehydrogenase|nr:uncharacterized protein [Variibacter sp.]